MEEPTPDMLPDPSQTEPVPAPEVTEPVSEDVKPPVPESPGPTEDAPADTETPSVPSGYVPYSRFKEETKKRKELEAKLKDLEASPAPEEEETVEPEENSSLAKEVRELKMEKYLSQYPELNDKREDLDAYLEEHSNLSLDQGVNLFRVEYGLIGAPPSRKGLEKVVAGPKTAPTPKWTIEQIDELRQKDEKRWQKLMNEGVFDETLRQTW